jgi:hypothetical protein
MDFGYGREASKIRTVVRKAAGRAALMGQEDSFLSRTRLKLYGTKRNDPTIPQVRKRDVCATLAHMLVPGVGRLCLGA